MNFELTDDQVAIQRTARDFLAARYPAEEVRRLALEDERGFTDAHWEAVADLGWPALVVAEEDGGLGLGVVELVVLFEELGRALAPTPLLGTVAAELVLAAAGSPEQRAAWLPALAEGGRRGALAVLDDRQEPLRAEGGRLTGAKVAVADGASADVLVVAGPQGRHFVVDPGAAGVHREPATALDPARRLATVRFEDAEAEELPGEASRAYDVLLAATAAESVGVAQRALDLSVAYARERTQFGRPIGSFQAVSHACAQMLLETEGARSTALYAAWALDHEPQTAPLAAAMAGAYASDAGWRVPAAALQVHGGIGFTWEHDLHLLLRRGRANAAMWADARALRARVADLAGV
jgi:alkylation response protein AidB-like acyl-CoA dehydrogenase